MSMSQTLPLARYRYTFRMREPLSLPDYAGSLLRGQFGASLRRVSCMTGEPRCEGCPLRTTCPYAVVFEAPAPAEHGMQRFSRIPNPYVIEPPALGSTAIARNELLVFNLVLFGRALDHLPIISFAMQRAIEQGLGTERARSVMERIDVQQADELDAAGAPVWAAVWHRGDAQLAAHTTTRPIVAPIGHPSPTEIRLNLLTPLRLQQQGQPIRPHALTPRKLVADLLRRITLMAEFHAGQPEIVPDVHDLVRHAEALDHRHDLRWHDWSRYSSRQQREMTLGGALGNWALSGKLEPLLPWLHLGQWLHVGKNATLGLGAYQITSLS